MIAQIFRTLVVALVLTSTSFPRPGLTQELPEWSDAYFPCGILGSVTNLFAYQGDLIATGSLSAAGRVSVNGAARWDGFQWNRFLVDSGYAYFPSSKGLLVSQQYVRDNGDWSGRVLRWDGTRWTQLGGDLEVASGFIEFQGTLFAARIRGGVFKLENGEWHQVPLIGSPAASEWVQINSFSVFQDKLYVGGRFYFGQYDGAGFQALLPHQSIGIEDLQEHQGYLVAAGSFSEIGGVPASNIARWDGTAWTPLGLGLSGGWPGYGRVDRLGLYRGDLIAVGWFQQAGGNDNALIARWDGKRWSSVGPQRSPFKSSRSYDSQLLAITTLGDLLFVAGRFSQVAGKTALAVAVWDGTEWGPLTSGMGKGLDGPVNAFTTFNGMLIVGGGFSRAGSISARNIAAWNGNEWLDIGGGVDDDVEALTVWNDKLIAAGYFRHAGGRPAHRIAAWDGTHWEPLGTGMEYAVMGVASYGGDLIAVGYFSQAGSVQASRVAAWNGSNWRPLGGGVEPGNVGQAMGRAVAVYGGDLIVAGSFTRVGDVEAQNIARWDGTSWHALGTGTDGGVAALLEWNGSLIVSGFFARAGEIDAASVAAWDGLEWHAMGDGVRNGPNRAYVKCMTHYGDRLVIGGRLSDVGGSGAGGIAAWDGTAWRPFGTEPYAFWNYDDSYINTLIGYQGDLYLGGMFSRVQAAPSAYIARWQLPSARPASPPPLRVIAGTETEERTVRFSLPQAGQVSMEVFDLSGRRVFGQGGTHFPPGEHQLSWNGTDRFGRRVPQGIYFARLTLPGSTETRRIIVRR